MGRGLSIEPWGTLVNYCKYMSHMAEYNAMSSWVSLEKEMCFYIAHIQYSPGHREQYYLAQGHIDTNALNWEVWTFCFGSGHSTF